MCAVVLMVLACASQWTALMSSPDVRSESPEGDYVAQVTVKHGFMDSHYELRISHRTGVVRKTVARWCQGESDGYTPALVWPQDPYPRATGRSVVTLESDEQGRFVRPPGWGKC